MNDETVGGTRWSFWVISAVGLMWNVFGVMNFVMQMTADMAAMPESQRAILEHRPVWSTGAFALAVVGGAFGCLLLLLRKSAAFYLLVASLLAVVVATIPLLGMGIALGLFEISMYFLMPLIVAAFLVWYSKYAESKGWISVPR